MSKRFDNSISWIRKIVVAIAFVSLCSTLAQGQTNFFNTIGGIKIDPSGVLHMNTQQFEAELRERLQENLDVIDPEVAAESDLRMISVRGIEEALKKSIETGEELPDEIKFMAGIQRLQYVFVYPEKNDIVLAGKGEGWVVDARGNVVGKSTGQPVLRLEDFIVAIQTANNARRDLGISVSINPTEEGLQNYAQLMRGMKASQFSDRTAQAIEESMGQQDISLTGVPTDSRYAQVLVAADFRMKRLAMGFDEAPVKMPSVLDLAQKRRKAMRITPRFWLECAYDSVKKSEDGMAWEISGPGAKALTQEEALLSDGSKKQKSDPTAVKWAKSMTENFSELASKEPVFAELRNILDMSVIAALIEKEKLLSKANLELPLISGNDDRLELAAWESPKSVATQCSYRQMRSGEIMVTASGGIQVGSWEVLEKVEVDNSINEARKLAASTRESSGIFWNGN